VEPLLAAAAAAADAAAVRVCVPSKEMRVYEALRRASRGTTATARELLTTPSLPARAFTSATGLVTHTHTHASNVLSHCSAPQQLLSIQLQTATTSTPTQWRRQDFVTGGKRGMGL